MDVTRPGCVCVMRIRGYFGDTGEVSVVANPTKALCSGTSWFTVASKSVEVGNPPRSVRP